MIQSWCATVAAHIGAGFPYVDALTVSTAIKSLQAAGRLPANTHATTGWDEWRTHCAQHRHDRRAVMPDQPVGGLLAIPPDPEKAKLFFIDCEIKRAERAIAERMVDDTRAVAHEAAKGLLAEDLLEELKQPQRQHAAIMRLRAGFKAFADWCDSAGLPSLPAGPESVAAFVINAPLSPARLKKIIAAVSWTHQVKNLPDAADAPLVAAAMRYRKRTAHDLAERAWVECVREAVREATPSNPKGQGSKP